MKLSVSFADYSKFPPDYWKWLAIIGWILFFIVLYCWLGLPDLEAHNCVAENGGVSIPHSPPTTPQESKERIRSGRKQLLPVLGLASIDLSIIAKIESNNNPLAVSYKGAKYGRGLYQISEIALKDFNDWHTVSKLPVNALHNPIQARKVAEWYISRLKEILAKKGISASNSLLLISWNWGIGNCLKWYRQGGDYSKLPRETQIYLSKYYELAKTK